MILLIDNYDSFTYNLYQYISELSTEEVKVIRNDDHTAREVLSMDYSRLVISPGPGKPENAGICIDVIRMEEKRPILGICLGHQAICAAFGIRIVHAKKLCHGKISLVRQTSASMLFKGINETFPAGRYHSLAADPTGDYSRLRITSVAEDGEIMSVEHKDRNIFGIQFHPESILTACGKKILSNFLEVT